MRLMILGTLLLAGCTEGTEQVSEIDEDISEIDDAALTAVAKQIKCEQFGCERPPPPEYEWEAELDGVLAAMPNAAPTQAAPLADIYEDMAETSRERAQQRQIDQMQMQLDAAERQLRIEATRVN